MASRPDWRKIAGKKINENNKRVDVPAVDSLEQSPPQIWKEFIEYHTSKAFYDVIIAKFGKHLKQYHPQYNFEKMKVGMRGRDVADIYLDCLVGINTPVKEKSTVSAPHLDHPKEVWAAMLYMRDSEDFAGGDFVVNKLVKIPEEYGKRQIKDECVAPHNVINYEANYCVCFVNSPISVHEVTQREVTDKPRLLVNFVLEIA
jgi:hypothetical protein